MHILLVAYRFPPQTGGGVIRAHRFAKYLGRGGDQVTVVTVDAGSDGSRRDLPANVRVLAVPERGLLPRVAAHRDGAVPDTRSPGTRLGARARVLARAALYQWAAPDHREGFIAPAVAAATREARTADIVLATGGPWSDFVAGQRMARVIGVPLVLDYRDPWTTYPRGWSYAPGLRARLTARRRERELARGADLIVSAHEGLPERLETGLGIPGLVSRSHWIPNGYDPEDFDGLEAPVPPAADPSSRFTLTWAGSLYTTRTLAPVYGMLAALAAEGAIPLERVKLRVLDRRPDRIRAECPEILRPCLETPGEVPHREVIPYITGSTVNLLVDIDYEGPVIHTPGKLYEYLRADRPIIALTGEGVQADLIREAGAGWVVRPDDAAGLRGAILDAWRQWSAGEALPSPQRSVVARFDRAAQTARLRELLAGVVASRPTTARR